MGRTITKSEASALERAAYLEAAVATWAALDEALRLLRILESTGRSPGASRDDAVGRLRSAKRGLDAELTGFLSDAFRFRTLDSRTLSEIERLSHELFEAMLDTPPDEIVRRATLLLDCWNGTPAGPRLVEGA